MTINQFRILAEKCWNEKYANQHLTVPPEAKFVTGVAHTDAFFHYMLVDNGVEMILENYSIGAWRLVDYCVVDEKKFTWFLLRWA